MMVEPPEPRYPPVPPCPLCGTERNRSIAEIEGTVYWRCEACDLRFLDPAFLPTLSEEAETYSHHRNEVDDPDYRRFLARLAEPLAAKLAPGSRGLDHGCGPGPALAAMLSEAGYPMALYDPIFQPDPEALARAYDFITCTEVAEHFHDPAAEFIRFDRLLRPGGWLGLMTMFAPEDTAFAAWHYRRDPTHVVFYSAETFAWIATHHGWTLEIPRDHVVLMRKPL
jgi:SAM-dependent methyltransferase